MKKKVSMVLVIAMVLSMAGLTACGGGKQGKKSPYEGKWVAILAEMIGVQVSVEESFGGKFEFVAKSGGKADVTIGKDKGKGKWSVDGDKFTLTIEGEKMEGTLGKDSIAFENMMGMGVKVIFAKDGTDAMDPSLYMGEEEKAMLGEWMSDSVEEVLGDGPQTTMEGVENINDGLRLNFKKDHQVSVIYKGEEIGDFKWSVALGYCTIETEEPAIYVTILEDQTLEVSYSNADDYYTFHCIKSS